MKPISELINNEEPGWALVADWINDSTNTLEILPKNEKKAIESLYQTQVTTRSPMGAVIYETGGILIDNGWIRILGSGNHKLDRTLPNWNKGKSFNEFGEQPSIVLIADDVVGGFFGINGGVLGEDLGKVYYFAPDSLEWEPMHIGYSDFLWWTFTGDLSKFYKNVRWTNWEKEITQINGNQAYSFYPFLWTEHNNIDELNRKADPISEIWELQQEFGEQLKKKE